MPGGGAAPGRAAVCQPSGGRPAGREAAMLARRAARGGRAEAGRREGPRPPPRGCGEEGGSGCAGPFPSGRCPGSQGAGRGRRAAPSPRPPEGGEGGCARPPSARPRLPSRSESPRLLSPAASGEAGGRRAEVLVHAGAELARISLSGLLKSGSCRVPSPGHGGPSPAQGDALSGIPLEAIFLCWA